MSKDFKEFSEETVMAYESADYTGAGKYARFDVTFSDHFDLNMKKIFKRRAKFGSLTGF